LPGGVAPACASLTWPDGRSILLPHANVPCGTFAGSAPAIWTWRPLPHVLTPSRNGIPARPWQDAPARASCVAARAARIACHRPQKPV